MTFLEVARVLVGSLLRPKTVQSRDNPFGVKNLGLWAASVCDIPVSGGWLVDTSMGVHVSCKALFAETV